MTPPNPQTLPYPRVVAALLRHFADLRDGTHGGAVSRADKESLFRTAVDLLDPYARRSLEEINEALLLDEGTLESTGVIRSQDTGLVCSWTLSWQEQTRFAIPPITIQAFYGRGFHHPHLRGGTVGEWPLNVFDGDQAAAELPTLRTIAAAEIHNLVFLANYSIVPASKPGTTTPTR